MAVAYKFPTLVTAEELFSMPDGERYELVRGELKESKMPTGDNHGAMTAWLSAHISIYIYSKGLGDCFAAETGFLVARDPDTVLAPDFAFITKARLTFSRGGGYVRAVPDLVLETRSPSDRPREVAEKVKEWLDAGVSMVLELNPARKILTVYRPDREPIALGENDTFDGEELLPGFSLPLTVLFED
ncbi:MAG: Uma2 family endonuclease [Armatimonas sp.]